MALVVAAPLLIALVLLSLPVMLPIAALQQARAERRKRACVERWPCGWCVAPLRAEALDRADAIFGAQVDRTFGAMGLRRVVRDLHACCPRCDAGHRYEEKADRFVLLDGYAFARCYGASLATAVPPATAELAWPWFPLRAATHLIALTRDSVCMGDDVDGPHGGTLAVPAEVDVAAIGEALLRSPWLAHVGGTATWTAEVGSVTLLFGLRSGMPFVHRVGPGPARAGALDSLHVRYAAQRDPDALCSSLERR